MGGLAKGSGREQQVNINLINMALEGSSVMPMSKYLHALVEERSLVPNVVAMLEQVCLLHSNNISYYFCLTFLFKCRVSY